MICASMYMYKDVYKYVHKYAAEIWNQCWIKCHLFSPWCLIIKLVYFVFLLQIN